MLKGNLSGVLSVALPPPKSHITNLSIVFPLFMHDFGQVNNLLSLFAFDFDSPHLNRNSN